MDGWIVVKGTGFALPICQDLVMPRNITVRYGSGGVVWTFRQMQV